MTRAKGWSVLSVGAGVCLLALLLAACSGAPAAANHHSGVHTGGTVTFGLNEDPVNLDPSVASADPAGIVDREVFDSLVYETSSGKIVPWLATSWKVSNDYKTFTFTLRHGVRFQDGTPFNAAAVKFTLDRVAAPATESQLAVDLLGPYKSSVVVSKYVVQVNFTQPYTGFLPLLAEPWLGVVSPTAVRKEGKSFADHPVGTGPFEVVSYVPDSQVILRRYAAYNWPPQGSSHKGASYVSELDFKIVPNDLSRVGAVQSGELAGAWSVPAAEVKTLKAASGITINRTPPPGLPYTLFLNEARAPWNNTKARIAIRDALNLKAIIKAVYFGQYVQAWSPLAPSSVDYDASLVGSWRYDPTESKTLLNGLGYRLDAKTGYREFDGAPLTITYLSQGNYEEDRLDVAELMAADLKAVGIKVNIVSESTFGALATDVQKGNYDLAGLDDAEADPSLLSTFFLSANRSTPSTLGFNWANVDSSALNHLLTEGSATTGSTRQKIYGEVQKDIIDSAIAIPVYVPIFITATRSSLHGVTYDRSTGYPTFYSAWAS